MRGADITRCSVCLRRPYDDGTNHATHCSRRGEPADAREDAMKADLARRKQETADWQAEQRAQLRRERRAEFL